MLQELFMPTYEYRCDSCRKNFEVFQKITEDPLKKCEDCGGSVQRLVNASHFILKGNGWYKTDYASKDLAPKNGKPACESSGSKPSCRSCPSNSES
jgi:putative FmdB family regulatory protein